MLFNSLSFAIFFPIVFLLYWALPHRLRWILLLISSYYFYMSWNPAYVLLILSTTAITYGCALGMEKASAKTKKLYFSAALLFCLGLLFLFKYYNFFAKTLDTIFQKLAIPLHPVLLTLLLPVGISFYIFQTIGYMVDVYRGEIPAEKHFGIYALYVSFFPQLVAGPIERSQNLIPQLRKEYRFSYDSAVHAVLIMVWGFFKKIAIADPLAEYTDPVFNQPENFQGLALIVAAVFFTIQIYCDFSGYSDIAIGSAKLLGIDLMTNFKSPYLSVSMREFWSRWHISLSSWFRDYVYIPLGGNKKGPLRRSLNTMIIFLLSGLWHGASWTFVLWGGFQGLCITLENWIRPRFPRLFPPPLDNPAPGGRLHRLISILFTFLLVNLGFILFRANSLGDAVYIYRHALTGITSPLSYVKDGYLSLKLGADDFLALLLPVLLLFFYDLLSLKADVIKKLRSLPALIKWPVYWIFILFLALCTMTAREQAFIYFQF